MIIFLASYLREKREVLVVGARRIAGVTLPPLKHLGPMLVVWGAAMVLLVFIRDLGSSLMFFGAFLALIYMATNRFSFVVIGLADVPGRRLVLRLDGRPRRATGSTSGSTPTRIPAAPASRSSSRCSPRLTAACSGPGIGESLLRPVEGGQPLIPEVQTDFIYALIVNELGLFGGCGVIVIYALIAARGFKIAMIAPDGFSKLLAAGLTAVFALQAFVIIGGVTRVIPLTGVTLPFVS